jgi:hypothetical protein
VLLHYATFLAMKPQNPVNEARGGKSVVLMKWCTDLHVEAKHNLSYSSDSRLINVMILLHSTASQLPGLESLTLSPVVV